MTGFTRFLEENGLERFEGDKGLKNLTKIAEHLGYQEDGFKWGTPIEKMLSDNQGLMEVICEWIEENRKDEFLVDCHDLKEGMIVCEEDADPVVYGKIISIDEVDGTCQVKWNNGHETADMDVDLLIPKGGW